MYDPIEVLLAKASGTTNSELFTDIVPTVWASQVEKPWRETAMFDQFAVPFGDLEGKPGDELVVPLLPDTADLVADLDENDDTVGVTQITADSSVTLTPKEVGGGIAFTRFLTDRMQYDLIADSISQLSYSNSRVFQAKFASLYTGLESASQKIYSSRSVTSINGTSADDILMLETMLDIGEDLRVANAEPFADGRYKMFLNPHQYRKLSGDSKYQRYIENSSLVAGEMSSSLAIKGAYKGTFENIDIFVSNYIKGYTNTNGVTVYKGLLLCPRWAAIAWKRRPALVIDPTLYDFGRKRQIAILSDYAIKLLNSERAWVVETA